MGRTRFVRPDTTRLDISRGDFLIVKRRLTAGEERAAYRRGTITHPDGTRTIDRSTVDLAFVTAYLIDWNLVGLDDKPFVIRGQPVELVEAALSAIDPDSFKEINNAIQAHDDAMIKERAAEKNDQGGGTPSSAISPSPSVAAGELSGSAIST